MNNSNNVNEEKKSDYKIECLEFENFNPTKSEKITTTQRLARLLNERLKPAFQDYRGCFIEPLNQPGAPAGVISVTLIFNQLSADRIDTSEDAVAVAFMPVEAMKAAGSNIAERSRALSNQFINGRKYNITEDAKSALSDLFPTNQKINWNNVAGEGIQKQGWTQDAYCYVKGIDIIKVLEFIYGAKDKNTGVKAYYYPTILSPVSNVNLTKPNNWLVDLQLMTDKSTADLCEEAGYISTGMFNCVQA